MSEIKTPIKTLNGHALEDTEARAKVNQLSEEIDTFSEELAGVAPLADGLLPSAATRKIHVGENLFNADNLTLGAGWSYSNGVISHATGQTEAASFTFNGVEGEDYLLEFTTNYSSGEFATYGIGSGYPNLAYNGTTNIVIPLKCWGEANLVMTPYALTGITHPAFTMSDIKLRKIQDTGDEITLNYISITTVQNVGNYGNRNVIFGYNSATKATGSTRLVVLGNAALKDLQGGHRNIAIGGSSLQNMIGGNENVAIGADAAIYLQEGEKNFAMGVGALAYGKKLVNNIGIGSLALSGDAESTAYDNVAIGQESGYHANGNARLNVFIGKRAGYQNYAGYGNTYIGVESGTGKPAAWNTMIGCRANAGDGHGNCTVIGANASITGESRAHSIVIGANAQATKSRQCVIGSTEVSEVIFCGNKKIIFNDDGTVTWEAVT